MDIPRFISYIALFVVTVFLIWAMFYQNENERSVILNERSIGSITYASDLSIAKNYDVDRMTYILNGSHICGKSNGLLLIVVIISTPANGIDRRVLRETWIKPLLKNNSTSYAFFVGRTKNQSVDENIFAENLRHNDIVLLDFDESYYNLTLKTILMLRWIRDFCPNARFILKSDEDTFVNTYALLGLLSKRNLDGRSIYGHLAHGWTPIRNNDSKWKVTFEQYDKSVYPDFVTGPSYLMGIDAVSDLIEACFRLPYLFLEDVFVTGICAQNANVYRISDKYITNGNIPDDLCNLYSRVSSHSARGKLVKILWKILNDFSVYKICLKISGNLNDVISFETINV